MSGLFALTPLQNSMYAGSVLTSQPWHYVEQVVVHLRQERLDPEAMKRAWSELAAAYPGLRNIIDLSDPQRPMQRTQLAAPVNPVHHDWSDRELPWIAEAFAAFLAEDRNAGIDPTQFPAFRVTIFSIGPTESKLVWSFPHSLLDGRCFAPLLEEVFSRYRGILGSDPVPDPSVDVADPFQDHCRQLAQMSHAEGIAHFAEALAGWDGGDGLVRKGVEPARKTVVTRYLTGELGEALTRLAAQAGVATSTVLIAAWGIVAGRYAGQSDVVVGNVRNGRYLVPGSGSAAGCFITTVPMRLKLTRGITLGEVLADVRAEQIASRPFEHTPLSDIRKHLSLPPDRQILESVVMVERGTLNDQLKALGGEWAKREVELFEESDTPVTVAAYLGPRMQIDLEFDPALVPDGPRLAEYLVTLLTALGAAGPETPLAAVSMLPKEEIGRLYDLAGPPAADDQVLACIDSFEQIAATNPDKVALMQPGQAPVTYGALDAAANRLACELMDAGVAPDDIVGICMARSAGFITAMLAIWKAGAVFVPMDPSYPVETLNIIAEDSRARLVLSDDTAPEISAQTRRPGSVSEMVAPVSRPDRQAMTTERVAYVIFTSGSTGRPKGVMISHQSLAGHCKAVGQLYELSGDDRVLQFAALSFDVALEEIIPTLLSGATLVLRSAEMSRSIDVFLERCAELQITMLNLPTGFWVALTEELDSREVAFPPQVRLVIVGGERVPLSVLRRWRRCLPDIRWMNGYGPTETTITCTAYEATNIELEGDSVPIGRPLGHARGWVLSGDGALAPEGAEGELFISGPAVALGYVNDPVRTRKGFVNADFDAGVGRVYATGDRVIWRDGLLYYLGRMDRQIKLRGFRIEPGQIEAALEAQDNIDRAYAALHAPADGPPQLTAWYSVAQGRAVPSPELVQGWIAKVLPPQMRPLVVAVEDWPQTPGGKIDVAQLPSPDARHLTDAADPAENTPLTTEVAELFAQVLQTEGIGPDTSFFDAGGDSLSLLRLLPLIEEKFGTRIQPTALYSNPTPNGAVQALQAQDPDPLVVIPIQPSGDLMPLYAVHVLGDNGSFFRPMAAALGDAQPVYGLTVGLLSDSTPTTVADIARFYLYQIERHYPEGPLSLIAVSAGSYVTFELAQQLLQSGRDVQAVILLDAEGPGGRPRVGWAARVMAHLRNLMGEGWPYVARQLAARREAHAHDLARDKLDSAHEESEAATPEDISDVADFIAANTMAIEVYEPQPYPRPLTIFRAGNDRFDSAEAIETGLGWHSVAAAGFEILDVPGDHLSILDPPNVTTLATRIADVLRAGQRDGPAGSGRG